MKVLVILLSLVCVPFAVFADTTSVWVRAKSCFKAENFDCAYEAAFGLLETGDIVIGNDQTTTESMMFFQLAFVEKSARATYSEVFSMNKLLIEQIGRQPNRLPFVFGLTFLTAENACRGESECDFGDQFLELYCKFEHELPPISVRPLEDEDHAYQLSDKGKQYFDRVMRLEPDCKEAIS